MSYTHGKSIIQIAVADDHEMLREAICSAIDMWENCKVVFQSKDGYELLEMIKQKPLPDLILLDAGMPGMDGIDTAKILRKDYPELKILMFSIYKTELAITRMIKAGVNGYICKSASGGELKRAIYEIMRTGYYLSGDAARILTHHLHEDKKNNNNNVLNECELSFIKHLCSDMTYKEIAYRLEMSERQVDYIRESLFNRFDVQSRVGLALYAFNSGVA